MTAEISILNNIRSTRWLINCIILLGRSQRISIQRSHIMTIEYALCFCLLCAALKHPMQ